MFATDIRLVVILIAEVPPKSGRIGKLYDD
jgi:hypothetical protein